MGTYLFAGASSKIAIQTAALLQDQGHKIIGVSTKLEPLTYNEFHTVERYDLSSLPKISEPLEGLVYFPGTINLKPFHRLSEQDFVNDYQINSLGAVAVTQSYLPNLKQATHSSVVFISTVAVSVGMPYHASIAMAKGAIEGLTKSLAAELAPLIRVNCIAPSLADTPLGEKFINTPEKLEAAQKRNPLKKVGTGKEIAEAVHFLLSSKSSWITGQVIAVDGGMSNIKLL